ncbi:MAG TPA: PIN domain-containing protein [Phototrophicaceae bacterium]|nr:PIN domain-containing protein [Phototrophicaceae bacterium]
MRIATALAHVQRLCIETAPYIYYVENHPIYADKMKLVFQIVETGTIEIKTSVVTLTETLMKPIRANDQTVADSYRELLTDTDYIRLISVTPEIAQRAAYVRARYNLRTPDALHVASALEAKCDAFLTNDLGIKRVTELKVLVLDELELAPPTEA